jgi:hypothetical protein
MTNAIAYALFAILAGLLLRDIALSPLPRRMAGSVFALFVPRVTGADLTLLSELLKQVYDPVIEEQQNLEAFTWKEFEAGDDPLGGQGWTFENKMGGNQEGIGARAERDNLTNPGLQRYKTGLIYWRLLYGGYEITGPAIEAARSNLYAFAVARTEEINGLTRDMIKDFNRQVYGDGSATLAVVTAEIAGNQFTVANGMYLRLNMLIDVWTANAINFTQRAITALTPNADGTMTVTYDGANATAVVGDFVTRFGSAKVVGGVRTGLEMEGLKKIADDGTVAATYLNISRTTYPLFKGHLFANAGVARNLSLDLLQQCEDQIYRASGKRPDWVRMNLGQRRKYFDLVAPDKRYMTGTIDGGYERLDYNGNTLTVDIDHPLGEITMLRKEVVKKYELRKFGMLDFDGLTIRMQGNTDVYRGYIGMYANLASKHPACTLRLIDLQEPTFGQWVS